MLTLWQFRLTLLFIWIAAIAVGQFYPMEWCSYGAATLMMMTAIYVKPQKRSLWQFALLYILVMSVIYVLYNVMS